MSNFDGFRLDHPDFPGPFEATANLTVNLRPTSNFVFDTQGDFIGAINGLVNGNASQKENIVVGRGGTFRATITLTQFPGSGNSWGGADPATDDAIQLGNELAQQLRTAGIDSTRPATFEHGEFSSGGRYGPISVAVPEVEIPNDLEQNPSSVECRIDLLEIVSDGNVSMPAP